MDNHLLGTNILSKIFYGNVDIKNFVDNLIVGVETIVYIECIQGSISNSDKRRIKRSLQSLKFYSLTDNIAQKAIELYRGLFKFSGVIISRRNNCGNCFGIRFNFNHLQRKSFCDGFPLETTGETIEHFRPKSSFPLLSCDC